MLCMFHQTAKIYSQCYNNLIIFKSIFLYLIEFWQDFCWLILRHTKRYNAWWLYDFCNWCVILLKKKEKKEKKLKNNANFKQKLTCDFQIWPINANFEGKMTCGFINGMRSLVNITEALRNLKNFSMTVIKKFQQKINVQKSYVSWHWRVIQTLMKN